MKVMIRQIGDQKERRRAAGSNHAALVPGDSFLANKSVAVEQEHGAGGVQGGVDGGQVGYGNHDGVWLLYKSFKSR